MLLKKINLLEDLNEQQKQAVEYFDTPLRIIAGAGSGKTKVLTRKVAYLINDKNVPVNKILALTFTNKACNEMAERIAKYTPDKSSKLQIYTFHSLCAQILRKHIRALGYHQNFLIADEADRNHILKEIYSEKEISTHEISLNSMSQYISWAKSFDLSSVEFANKLADSIPPIIPQIYQAYMNKMAAKGALDFDDLIITTHLLFTQRPDIAEKYRKQFKYILIDEFQDTSMKQYEIIKAIVSKDTHLTIVGDPDQTIYTWRGADVNLILNFDRDYPDAKTIVLDQNYRSTRNILDAANKLIKHNKNRYHKDLVTNSELGANIEFYHGFNPEAEARWVVQKINELKKQKNQLKNIAILYRSNHYSRPFEEALINENINHKIFNGTKFFQRSEIKDAISYLWVLYNGQTLSLERVINLPPRGIGEVKMRKITAYAHKQRKSLFKCLQEDFKSLPIDRATIINGIYPFMKITLAYAKLLQAKNDKISAILDNYLIEIGYYKYIEGNKNLRGTAIENVKELISSIQTWEAKNPDKTIEDYLAMVSLLSATDEVDDIPNYVSLMTIHSAKGLEFDNVFIVGLCEGIFPSSRAINKDSFLSEKSDFQERQEALEEERRLAYVAVTRAKKRLFISDSRGKLLGSELNKQPSRFIAEMGINVSDVILVFDSNTAALETDINEDQLRSMQKNIVVGDIISHVVFGEGEVIDVNSNEIVVEFIHPKQTKTLNKFHPAIKVITK